MKFLIIVVALVAVVWFVFLRPSLKSSMPRSQRKDLPSETMQECCVCGVFVSQKEGIIQGEKFFCSKACKTKATKC